MATIKRGNATIKGDYNVIIGNNNIIKGDYNDINEDHNIVNGDFNNIKGNDNKVKGDHNGENGLNNIMKGDYNNRNLNSQRNFQTSNAGNGSSKFSNIVISNGNIVTSDDRSINGLNCLNNVFINNGRNNNISFNGNRNISNSFNTTNGVHYGYDIDGIHNQVFKSNNYDIDGIHNNVAQRTNNTNSSSISSNHSTNKSNINNSNKESKHKVLNISEKDKDEVEDDADKACIICFANKKRCAAIPCGHFMSCISCTIELEKTHDIVCPTCREPVDFFNIMYV